MTDILMTVVFDTIKDFVLCHPAHDDMSLKERMEWRQRVWEGNRVVLCRAKGPDGELLEVRWPTPGGHTRWT